LALIAEFAVVVIFDDDGACTLGPAEECQASRKGKNGASGKLVGGRNESNSGTGRQLVGLESVAIDGDR